MPIYLCMPIDLFMYINLSVLIDLFMSLLQERPKIMYLGLEHISIKLVIDGIGTIGVTKLGAIFQLIHNSIFQLPNPPLLLSNNRLILPNNIIQLSNLIRSWIMNTMSIFVFIKRQGKLLKWLGYLLLLILWGDWVGFGWASEGKEVVGRVEGVWLGVGVGDGAGFFCHLFVFLYLLLVVKVLFLQTLDKTLFVR